MNPRALEEKVEAVLEVIVGKGKDSKVSLVYASRINGNGSWRYVRNNGQKLCKKTSLNPKQMAYAMGEKYHKLGKKGQISYYWEPTK